MAGTTQIITSNRYIRGNLVVPSSLGTIALMVTEVPAHDDERRRRPYDKPFLSVLCDPSCHPIEGPNIFFQQRQISLIFSTCDHETGGSFHVAALSADSTLEIRFSEQAPLGCGARKASAISDVCACTSPHSRISFGLLSTTVPPRRVTAHAVKGTRLYRVVNIGTEKDAESGLAKFTSVPGRQRPFVSVTGKPQSSPSHGN